LSRTVSIAEVAAAAGVGVGTVSRVLSGSERVSDATRRKVLDVMADMDYRPSRLASGLSRGRTNFIGIMVPYLTRPSVVGRLAGVLAHLQEANLDCVVCDIETVDQRDRHLSSFTMRHSVDGVMVVSLPLPRIKVRRLGEVHMPLVAVDVDIPGIPRVVIDNVAGGRMATEHLLSLGHRRIGFVGDEKDRSLGFASTSRRLDGYLQALAAAGIPPDAGLIRRGPHGAEWAAETTSRLLDVDAPPTAVFAASDTQAVGVLRAAAARGLAVPGDLSVVGFDDIEAAELLGLTTVRQPLRESGTEGARRMIDLLTGNPVAVPRWVLPLEMIVRQSTGRPHARAPARRRRPARVRHPDDPATNVTSRMKRVGQSRGYPEKAG
jgi:DNA-binding LacI/PurR family transcriptional regulator